MIKAIAIDDEPLALDVITTFTSNLDFIELKRIFTQGSSAIRYLKQFPVDLIFLDIQMPDMDGISLYESINQDIMVIFTTAYSEYAVKGFELNAIDYLLKPMNKKRFEKACLKALEYYDFKKEKIPTKNKFIYVRSEYSLIKISISNILFFETMDDYIKIHKVDGKPILTLMSMKKFIQMLPEDKFIRIHRSYTVPLDKIDSVRSKTIIIEDFKLPIGATYQKQFFDIYRSK
ncbi:MAG: LytTR family DNA-binding domain-containing protein [Gammaproteobacteria bacterium]|jgi:DNA-binding LytR/AlgR family response regulator